MSEPTLPLYQDLGDEGNYVAGTGLRNAINAALVLRRPLLLTGKPGTGKTTFAWHLKSLLAKWYLQKGEDVTVEFNPFNTRSTSTAAELFYKYDAIRRFHDRQSTPGGDASAEAICNSALPYIRLGALGLAIIRAADKEDRQKVFNCTPPAKPGETQPPHPKLPKNHPDFASITAEKKQLTVVLIDEVDKAPRDFPNDILNILEDFSFEIPELSMEQEHYKIEADKAWKPIVIFTSNSEKNLPEAFLRRCAYHDIPQPNAAAMQKIVNLDLGKPKDAPLPLFAQQAIRLWEIIRSQGGVYKDVSTAELLDFIRTMHRIATHGGAGKEPSLKEHGLDALPALLKAEAAKITEKTATEWMTKAQKADG